jgi:NADH dehydrogenase FAD-containing subunit
LARNHQVHVTLVDQHNYHQFPPLFYQVATAQLAVEDVGFSLGRIFRKSPNVDIKVAEINAVDPKARRISTKEGQVHQDDFLVLAAGAQANFLDIPGPGQMVFLSILWSMPSACVRDSWACLRTAIASPTSSVVGALLRESR